MGHAQSDHDFWTDVWATGRTGFHQAEVHGDLRAYAPRFLRRAEETVFVPLCGQSLDMPWLAAQGHHVIGAELVEQAVTTFFASQGLTPVSTPHGPGTRFEAGRISVLQGDVFELARVPMPRSVTAIWDRAAMVALPPTRRTEYVNHVLRAVAAPGARLLLNVFDHDPAEISGPPFAISVPEVKSLFEGCRLELLATKDGTKFVDRPERPVSRFDISTWIIDFPA